MMSLHRAALACAIVLSPAALWAAAGDSPPAPTPTTQECAEGQVWDADAGACVAVQDSRLGDADRMDAARELAYFGRPADAVALLKGHSAPDHPDVLTLRGFATREAGDWEGGVALYRAALARDPDHWLARSYLGLGLHERGDRDGAMLQLAAIRASGGRGTWAERALADAVERGVVADY